MQYSSTILLAVSLLGLTVHGLNSDLSKEIPPPANTPISNSTIDELNQPQCESAAGQLAEVQNQPTGGPIKVASGSSNNAWYNGPVANAPYKERTLTAYCQQTDGINGNSFASFLSKVYCDGTEGADGLHPQWLVSWDGWKCNFVPGLSSQDMKIDWPAKCGCKNQGIESVQGDPDHE